MDISNATVFKFCSPFLACTKKSIKLKKYQNTFSARRKAEEILLEVGACRINYLMLRLTDDKSVWLLIVRPEEKQEVTEYVEKTNFNKFNL